MATKSIQSDPLQAIVDAIADRLAERTDFLHDEALLSLQDVAARYRVHPKTVPQLVKDGRIPAPVPGWEGKNRWLKSVIVKHIKDLAKQEEAQN